MKRLAAIGLAASLALPALFSGQEKVDTQMIAKIRSEGLDRSKAIETFNYLTVNIGGRLTASPAYKRAVDWTEARLRQWGLDNVHLEPWEFGRGWELERMSLDMVEPRYMPVIAYPRGWSPSTKGRLTSQPVFLGGKSVEELRTYAGKLQGAIVMTQPIRENFIRADRPPASGDLRNPPAQISPAAQAAQRAATQELNALLQREKPGLVLEVSGGEHGTVFVTGNDRGAEALPT